jgi:hypothetical protein
VKLYSTCRNCFLSCPLCHGALHIIFSSVQFLRISEGIKFLQILLKAFELRGKTFIFFLFLFHPTKAAVCCVSKIECFFFGLYSVGAYARCIKYLFRILIDHNITPRLLNKNKKQETRKLSF